MARRLAKQVKKDRQSTYNQRPHIHLSVLHLLIRLVSSLFLEIHTLVPRSLDHIANWLSLTLEIKRAASVSEA
jgi:hypothetical protein